MAASDVKMRLEASSLRYRSLASRIHLFVLNSCNDGVFLTDF